MQKIDLPHCSTAQQVGKRSVHTVDAILVDVDENIRLCYKTLYKMSQPFYQQPKPFSSSVFVFVQIVWHVQLCELDTSMIRAVFFSLPFPPRWSSLFYDKLCVGFYEPCDTYVCDVCVCANTCVWISLTFYDKYI